jgi:ABC-type branched-subunit amino acid transport system ATPase component/ABC-type branched-subunit amino acid transport system permease subunit
MARALWAGLFVAAAALPLLTANTYYLYVASSVGLLTIVTAGLNVLIGFTGQMSLGHAGFYAIGAYAAGVTSVRLGLSPWLGVPVAVLVAAAVGAVVAGAALRVTGPYLAMVTIAFGIIVEGILVEWVSVTNGPGGIFNIPKPPLGHAYWIILAVAALALILLANLRRSAWGRALLAVKGSDVAAESLGLSAYYVRIVAFTVSAGFAGAAGGLFAHLNGYISPDSFGLQTSILFLLALLFGGEGRVAGPLLGSVVLTVLPEFLTSLTDYRLILYGSLLMVSIYWLPQGLVGALVPRRGEERESGGAGEEGSRGAGERVREVAQRRRVAEASSGKGAEAQGHGAGEPGSGGAGERGGATTAGALLTVEGASLAFGGVAALADVSLEIPVSGIRAVIGPNGAGKTTLLNALSGFYAPDAGSIRLNGASVAGRTPYAIARLGVSRTFQTAQVFGELTVLENVAVGVAGPCLGSVLAALAGAPWTRRADGAVLRQALNLLDAGGLTEWAHRPADVLPAGLRRRLEIVRALATAPRLLLLDEPAAGLSPAEIAELDAYLIRLKTTGGPSVVLVEHHMELVMAVSEHITVLDYGRVIASGTPDDVRANPAVIEAYLGAAA